MKLSQARVSDTNKITKKKKKIQEHPFASTVTTSYVKKKSTVLGVHTVGKKGPEEGTKVDERNLFLFRSLSRVSFARRGHSVQVSNDTGTNKRSYAR